MGRVRALLQCSECGQPASQWAGRCSGCRAWGSIVERPAIPTGRPSGGALSIGTLSATEGKDRRVSTAFPGIDRVLGGGLVPASVVLLAGEPGIGKSTLLLMALQAISASRSSLLITGEESVAQVKLRAERLGGAGKIQILAETELETVCETLKA